MNTHASKLQKLSQVVVSYVKGMFEKKRDIHQLIKVLYIRGNMLRWTPGNCLRESVNSIELLKDKAGECRNYSIG